MKTLVVGANGATGKHLVEHLLKSGQKVKIVIRPSSNIPDYWLNNEQLTVIRKNIAEITIEEMSEILADCQSVASCLGHNLTLKGIYGKPRRLVTDSIRMLCQAIIKNACKKPIKFGLMNTAGNSNRDFKEAVPYGQRVVIGLLRLLLPPHPDNEKAADYLRVKVGKDNPFIEWVVVRPDSLVDNEIVSEYSIHMSPTRSALFNPGKTSRINVGHFMASLLLNDTLWEKWKGQMPVIYNKDEQKN